MKLNPAYKLNVVAGENMLINTGERTVNVSTVFSLNEPAAWLWTKIGSRDFTEKMLVDWLCEEYEVTPEVAGPDVATMVLLWKEYGMVLPENE